MNKKAFGICLGASTISAVELTKKDETYHIERIIRKEHDGNPKAIFAEVVRELNPTNHKVLVTGRRFREFVNVPSITEPEAVEAALSFVAKGEKYDAVVSAGGETFIVYRLDHNLKVTGISTGNKCASGTGDFFLQQIKRMDLSIEEAVEAAVTGEPYGVSGRCSVFCKSDCTHALNKGVPVSNVTAGLCEMIGEKIVELVMKVPHENVLITGGTAKNKAVIKDVKKKIKNITVPEEAPYFEALGAAIAAFEKGAKITEELFNEGMTSFATLESLKSAEKLVTFRENERGVLKAHDKCVIGLDVGSTTTKAVLLRLSDDKILSSIYLRTNGNPVEASRNCYISLLKDIGTTPVNISGIGVTGSGRQIAGLYSLTVGIINEIIAHASAAVYFDTEVDTIFEIGGQDAKYTHITAGVASDYAMNEACSAGTGSFLEEAAYESLGVDYTEIADRAILAKKPPNFNDQCAAFISSDIKNASHEGISTEDILAGLVYSICFNYVNRVKGHRPVGAKVFMQGGVCYNKAVPLAMAAILKKPIVVPPDPGLMGAFGVALEIKKRLALGLLTEEKYDLSELIKREVINEKPFICNGGKEKCDLKCKINMIKIEGKAYPFGGACNKYYNQRFKIEVDQDDLDYVVKRNELAFGKYCPALPISKKAPRIGINKSFIAIQMFPLYYNFFAHLGCEIVTAEEMNADALHMQTTSFCYPAQISLALFSNLIEKNPDYIFMPHVEEMHVENGATRKEFSATCIFTQGEAFTMKQVFKGKGLEKKVINPTLNFAKGVEAEKEAFIKIGIKIGFDREKIAAAFDKAVKAQSEFYNEKKELGKQFLTELHKHPERTAVVLFGAPHNAFNDDTNKGIPKKLTSRGYSIIPFDMLPLEYEIVEPPHDEYMHWEIGQKMIKASQIVKKDNQLFGMYITNFLCAIDSVMVTYFRRIMKDKPSLTLEIDGHTADAGVDTRVEAFIDVVKNYIEIRKTATAVVHSAYVPARVAVEETGIFFVDSKGVKTKITDPSVKMIIPNMGDFQTELVAAGFRKAGVRAEANTVSDKETLRLGRAVTTGKECLPMILCIGSMLKYLENRKDNNEKLIVFQPKAAGYCRLGQYHVFMNMLIKERKLENVAIISLANEERYTGFGPSLMIDAWRALVTGDVLDDIRNSIWTLAQDPKAGEKVLDKEREKIVAALDGSSEIKFYEQLKRSAKVLKEIPLKMKLHDAPEVSIMGEIFVRRDAFSNKSIAKRLAEKGFVARTAHISEWLYYLTYMIKNKLHIPEYTMLGWLEFVVTDVTQRHIELKIKKLLEKSDLYVAEAVDIDDIVKYSEHILPKSLKGEPGMILGVTLRDVFTKYAGVVNIGPFSCMPVRYTEGIAANNLDYKSQMEAYDKAGMKLKDLGFKENDRMPFLTIEADGNPYPQLLEARFESFCLQAGRVAEKQGKKSPVKETVKV